jgi:CBS domain-containing protein
MRHGVGTKVCHAMRNISRQVCGAAKPAQRRVSVYVLIAAAAWPSVCASAFAAYAGDTRRARAIKYRRSRAMPIRSLRSIVAGRPPIVATSITTVVEAARTMKQHNIGALLVVDHTRLIGIFTERDALFRLLAEGRDPHATRLADVMTAQPQTIHPDEPFVRALRMMHEGKFRHLPVVEFDRPLGVVSVRDALDDDLYELRVDLEQRETMGE